MFKFFNTVLFLVVLPSSLLFCQSTSIQLDRPDQTECPYIVPVNYFQLEHGFNIENTNKDLTSFSFPSTLLKFGVNENFELRFITELISEKTANNKLTGFAPITIGFKTKICNEKGVVPLISFIGHLTPSNVGKEEFQIKYTAPSFRFTLQNTLTDKISLGYNLGAEWDGASAEPTYIYTLTTGISLTNKLGGYLEMYGFVAKKIDADNRFDCGLTYLISNDIIMDLSGGFGISKISPKNYLSLGFSYRFKTTKK